VVIRIIFSNGDIEVRSNAATQGDENMLFFNNFKMKKGTFINFNLIVDKVFTNLKEREVKSEERSSNYTNSRRNLSKLNFDQRPLMRVQPENPNKKLYYLQFLSGQPVWGLVKNS
jgi:hypothetical protein